LQEFRVTTTNANADAGRSSGAQVALVTKSGTDNFHGSLYEYHRNTVTAAAASVAVAWAPNFQNGLLKTIFGENKTTVRGGFRMTYDRMGSALAVAFDLNSTLGFTSQNNISANTYNVTNRLAPLFAAFGQNVRALPGITIPGDLKFPLQTPGDEDQRIEQSLDDKLKTPYNYSWNASVGREFGKSYALEVSYVGRVGRNLLLSRDVAHFNNLVDPKSGVDFYTAMRQIIAHRQSNAPLTAVQNIAYFENLFPGLAGNYSVLGATTRLTATHAACDAICVAD
jgi:hypothetical protein